jgi:hypothetical protein
MKEIICACGCGRRRLVRKADIKRGWGKYYNKSCKANAQEKRTGQYAAYKHRKHLADNYDEIDYEGPGWDAHKDVW